MFAKSMSLAMVLGLVLFTTAGAAYTPVPGDLLRTPEDATVVLVLDNGVRTPISADAYAVRYNNNFSLVKTVTLAERGSYSGDSLNAQLSLTHGSVFIYEVDEPGIFLVENGMKRLFSTWTGFEAGGHDLKNVQWVGQYTLYPTGAPVQ